MPTQPHLTVRLDELIDGIRTATTPAGPVDQRRPRRRVPRRRRRPPHRPLRRPGPPVRGVLDRDRPQHGRHQAGRAEAVRAEAGQDAGATRSRTSGPSPRAPATWWSRPRTRRARPATRRSPPIICSSGCSTSRRGWPRWPSPTRGSSSAPPGGGEAGGCGAPAGLPALIPFDAGAKAALQLTFEHSARLGHTYMGTEHILLALAEAEGDDGPLTAAGLDVARAEQFVVTAVKRCRSRRARRSPEGQGEEIRVRPGGLGGGRAVEQPQRRPLAPRPGGRDRDLAGARQRERDRRAPSPRRPRAATPRRRRGSPACVREIRTGGGLGEPRTPTTVRSVSCSAGCSGKSDATCPSGPTPSSTTSNVGTAGRSSGRAARAARRRSAAAAASTSSPPVAVRWPASGAPAPGRAARGRAARRGPASRCARGRRRAGTARRPTRGRAAVQSTASRAGDAASAFRVAVPTPPPVRTTCARPRAAWASTSAGDQPGRRRLGEQLGVGVDDDGGGRAHEAGPAGASSAATCRCAAGASLADRRRARRASSAWRRASRRHGPSSSPTSCSSLKPSVSTSA